MRGCSRCGPGRSVCRWRRRSGSLGIGPAALAASHSPRPFVRRDDDITIDTPGSPKTCDNPGRSSLCLEDRGSSTRGLGALTPGPHLLRATVGQKPDCTPPQPPAANSTNAAPSTRGTGRRYAPRLDLRPSAGRVPSGLGDPGIGIGGLRGRARGLEHLTAECSEIYVSPCASTTCFPAGSA